MYRGTARARRCGVRRDDFSAGGKNRGRGKKPGKKENPSENRRGRSAPHLRPGRISLKLLLRGVCAVGTRDTIIFTGLQPARYTVFICNSIHYASRTRFPVIPPFYNRVRLPAVTRVPVTPPPRITHRESGTPRPTIRSGKRRRIVSAAR